MAKSKSKNTVPQGKRFFQHGDKLKPNSGQYTFTGSATRLKREGAIVHLGNQNAPLRPTQIVSSAGSTQLAENTLTATKPVSQAILKDVVAALESLQLLEVVYGYVSDKECRIIGIANELSGKQRDAIWELNWDFQDQYPQFDIEILLIQRHGRPLSEVFEDTGLPSLQEQ